MTDSSKNQLVRTRVAPSPTGYPHIGTIYQALFNYAYAKKNAGKFVIRIEDTDRERFVDDAERKIFEAVDWFSLTEDESPRKGGEFGPYRQSERLDKYKKYALELVENRHAYYCFCTKERLESVRAEQQKTKKPLMYDKHCRNLTSEEVDQKLSDDIPFVIRLKIPKNTIVTIRDEIRGDVEFASEIVDDQVLLKSDGFPTYHLAVVVDDHLMEIGFVLRGEEWLPSSPKHGLLYDFFGWARPKFYHTPVLRNPDKSKLSKRHGHTNVTWYQEEGFLPEAILNFLALLGWTHPDEKEIFSLAEFIQLFDIKDIRAVAPIFDLEKLTWMNQHYIQNLSDDDLEKRILEFDKQLDISEELVRNLVPLVKSRMKTLQEFRELTAHFSSEPSIKYRAENEKVIVKDLLNELETDKIFDSTTIFASFKKIMDQHNVRMPVLYYLLTGSQRGLPLPESISLLGKEKTIKRLMSIQ